MKRFTFYARILLLVTILALALSTVAFASEVAEDLEIQVSPHTLNLASNGGSFTIHADVAYDLVAGVSVTTGGNTLPGCDTFMDDRGDLVVRCDLDTVKGFVTEGDATFVLEVTLKDGDVLKGEDTIAVISQDQGGGGNRGGDEDGNRGNGKGFGELGSTNWHVYGIVMSMPDDFIGEWVIDDEEFLSDENTSIGSEHGELVLGAYAHAVGNYNEFEERIAYRIETKSDYQDCQCDCESNWRVYGVVSAKPNGGLIGDWIVDVIDDTDDMAFTATIATNFREQFGPLEEGTYVVAAGCTEEGDVAVACMIATVSDDAGGSGGGGGGGGGGDDLDVFLQ